jgi:uncharacterized OB-fold protein
MVSGLLGQDTATAHVDDTDLENLNIGPQVEPVFKEVREGNILDFKYLRPVAS